MGLRVQNKPPRLEGAYLFYFLLMYIYKTVTMLQTLVENHANALIKANGITDENIEDMSTIPGWGCFWTQIIYDGKAKAAANAGDTQAQSYSYNRISDVWFVTSVDLFCENGIETWTVDDDTGEITYGRLDD